MPKVDLQAVPQTNATGYPEHLADVVENRWYRRLAPATGLTDFAASHVVLKPGAWSAHRHWHEREDELLVIVSGSAVLVDDSGRTPLVAGDIAAFPKNDGNGHCLINESDADCVFVVIGQSVNGPCHYPDVDMHEFGGGDKRRSSGEPFKAR
ncbi:cupin domain-containing protein [Blastomonas sp. AAP53]|uniref:cupin domain-containing protein n=1 Tax=Blastomonas sp. AAP53 TaxID=1248760 RepID=UPI000313D98B|nr:cupin domain-containing protein [Blastomonas sp. AAP53]